MAEKNDFTVFRKYEGDRKYYDYNFDMIKDELLKAVEGLIIEDKVIDYIDDLENIIEQMVDELNETSSDLKDFKQNYDGLEEEKNDLEGVIIYLRERIEELEERYDEVYEKYCDLIDKVIYGEE